MDTYEKKYKEALERARQFSEKPYLEDSKGIVDYIFPELKESEGERIRKALINTLQEKIGLGVVSNGYSREDYISWLKKQGEQKPADKIELKFHEGDWVVTSYGKVNQVVSVDKDGDGFTLDDGTYFSGSWKDMYHLWTIQDAKDGDILSYENEIFIVKKSVNINILYYCCYDREHFIIDSFYSLTIDDIGNITPATKEQRDTLERAITNAGYEWDAEKKELKKIEHKPANWIQELEDKLANATPKQLAEWKEKYFKEEPTEWSEGDEDMLKSIIATCELAEQDRDSSPAKHLLEMQTNWLKSLRPQSHWKPSEEHMKTLNEVINYCANGKEAYLNNYIYNRLIDLRDELNKL